MPIARAAALNDLPPLLDLFRELFEASKVSRHAEPREKAEAIWARTLQRNGLTVFVSEADSRFVATCMLFTAQNLCAADVSTASSRTSRPIPNMKAAATAAR